MTHSRPDPDRRLVPQLAHIRLVRPAEGQSPGPASAPSLALPLRQVCKVVRDMVSELLPFTAERVAMRRDRRRAQCHVRQIAMYVCHVSLSIPQCDVAHGFGRDRTTVRHACAMVEDRREDPAYDDFVGAAERLACAVFEPNQVRLHD